MSESGKIPLMKRKGKHGIDNVGGCPLSAPSVVIFRDQESSMKKLRTLINGIIGIIFFVKFFQYMVMTVMMDGVPEKFCLLRDFLVQKSEDNNILDMVKSASFQRLVKDVPSIFSSIVFQRDLDFCLVICFFLKGIFSIWPKMIGRRANLGPVTDQDS